MSKPHKKFIIEIIFNFHVLKNNNSVFIWTYFINITETLLLEKGSEQILDAVFKIDSSKSGTPSIALLLQGNLKIHTSYAEATINDNFKYYY